MQGSVDPSPADKGQSFTKSRSFPDSLYLIRRATRSKNFTYVVSANIRAAFPRVVVPTPHFFSTMSVAKSTHHSLILATQRYISVFHPASAMDTSFSEFLFTLLSSSHTTWSSLMLSLLYFQRYCHALRTLLSQPALPRVRTVCVRRIFFVSLLLAHKIHQDKGLSNKAWSAVTHLSCQEITRLEAHFLGLIQFETHVGNDEFTHFSKSFCKYLVV
jgi:hypothetical protein